MNNNTNDTNSNLNNNNIGNDTMLNRERENIVEATIQANTSIDEEKALTVNDQIKVKKRNKFVIFLSVLFAIIVLIASSFGIYKLTHKIMTYDDEPTTTTTTTTKLSELVRFENYLNNTDKVRKFASANYILMLSPYGYDLKDNKNYYLLLNISDNALINAKYGTYTLNEGILKLDDIELNYNESGISYNNESMRTYDTEMKYYQYKDNNKSYLLIINGTLRNEYALFIESDINNTTVKSIGYKETLESITLNDSTVFAKVNDNVTYNNYTLKMYS